MTNNNSDLDELDVFSKYALPGRRYIKLIGGNFMRLPDSQLEAFGELLSADAKRITDSEIQRLFDGDWRERLTASWLVGFDKRLSFRSIISNLLLEQREPYAGKGYCFALARFGSDIDAQQLKAYLERYLPDYDLRYEQPWALGALLLLDSQLGTELASEIVIADGMWDRWNSAGTGGKRSALDMEETVRSWCEFADRASG